MSHVFIAYTRDDHAFAVTLRDRLTAAELAVWMDDRTQPGERWREEIDQAIRASFAMLVLMSPAAHESQAVTYEWACAWGARIRVIPLVLEPTPLHPRLAALQPRDISDPARREAELTRLVDDLREVATQRVSEEVRRTVERARDDLSDYDPRKRRDALDSLLQIHHPAALHVLKQAISHPLYADVRIKAALYVVALDPANCVVAFSALREALSGADRDLRMQVLDALRSIADPAAVPDLVGLYNAGDEAIRATVEAAFAHLGGEAVPGLMALLRHGDERMQQSATHMVTLIGAEAIPALENTLRTSHTAARFIAAHVLGEIGSRAVVPTLLQALTRDDPHLQLLIARALGKLGDARAVPDLVAQLQSGDKRLVRASIEALRQIGSPDAVPGLCDLVMKGAEDLRQHAALALGDLGDARAVPALVSLLESDDTTLVRAAIDALGALRSLDAVEALASVLSHEAVALRRAALDVLVQFEDRATVPALLRALHDDDAEIVRIAAETLAQLGDRAALIQTMQTVQAQPVTVRYRVAERLKDRGPEAVPALLSLMRDDDPSVRWSVTQALTQIGGLEAQQGLLALLRDPDARAIWRAVADALAAFQSPDIVPGLLSLFTSSDQELHRIVTDTFFKLGPLAAPPLRAMLAGEDRSLLWRVVQMLGYTRDESVVEELLPLLADGDAGVRLAAAESLGLLAEDDAVPDLITALHSEHDPTVRASIEKALERIGTPAAVSALERFRSPGQTGTLRPVDPPAPAWLFDDPDTLDGPLPPPDADSSAENEPPGWLLSGAGDGESVGE